MSQSKTDKMRSRVLENCRRRGVVLRYRNGAEETYEWDDKSRSHVKVEDTPSAAELPQFVVQRMECDLAN